MKGKGAARSSCVACIKTSSSWSGEISIFALVSRPDRKEGRAQARVVSVHGANFPFPSLNVNIHTMPDLGRRRFLCCYAVRAGIMRISGH